MRFRIGTRCPNNWQFRPAQGRRTNPQVILMIINGAILKDSPGALRMRTISPATTSGNTTGLGRAATSSPARHPAE